MRPVEIALNRVLVVLVHDAALLPECVHHYCAALDGDGAAIFAAAERMGLEGIVSKQVGSRYRSGSSSAWLKTKCETESEFVVVGMAPGHLADGPPDLVLRWLLKASSAL